MDPSLRAVVSVCTRWIHLTSVVTLIGGFIYARFALAPALASLAEPERTALGRRVVGSFRPLMYTVLATILGSGMYNYLSKASYPPHYHMWMGIKLLLVLHIFAVSILYAMPEASESKRNRWATGIIISGLVIIAISGYLRWMSLR